MIRFDKRLLLNFDWVMLLSLLTLALIGLLNLYSAGYTAGTPFYLKQLAYYALGFSIVGGILCIDYRVLLKWNYVFYGMVLLLLVWALAFGKSIANTQRWIDLGFIRLQPSELAKLSLVVTLASYYYRKDTGSGFTLPQLMIPMMLTGVPALLILKQPDLGTAMMLVVVFGSMTLFVKLRWTTLITLSGAAIAAVPFLWNHLKPYQKQRLTTFMSPEADPLGSGFHIMQSKIAVGSGQKYGKGFLQGTQGHLDFLPERHTDFAFSVFAEEFGFIGCVSYIAIYTFFMLWGLSVALSSRDKFGVLLAFGVISLVFWQAFINLAMVMGMLPVVGVPLPLFSYGGSSLLTTLIGIGILMNVRMRRFMTTSHNQ